MTQVDVVLIGRNEGARLVAALASVTGQARQVVYVDSGSTDDSVAQAEAAGALVVNLDMTRPFTAARARNAGFDALSDPQFVLFIDGDCALVPGFIDAARAHLQAHPDLALVTGWRAEIHRDASIYNALCDWEWHRPAGTIDACGGDMMVRGAVWAALGGMNPNVIAAEDDEFCTRARKAGWRLERLPIGMTRHDAAMLRFGQWWARAVRTGHGFAQVGHLHPEYFVTQRRRVLVYGLAMPALAVLGLVTFWPLSVLALASYPLNHMRTLRGLVRDGVRPAEARRFAALLTLSKLPNMIGMARFHLRRLRRADMRIIEYK
ncbi:glycosyltransferase family A protein [Aestuariicoccus sp. MJ-SS9]|uniref:glycosyltransferase n=1 Tax=Aestuariicoccus sp. MJ-SS9 TaxID=3079855 RepID=UPI00290C7508|nr:glycosyltransferase family A protein [Aestuariicoccus sp. MJ-SS9]MDU8910816.1 glycosyltransferase family A protein [Aestuariicoccus sp. MJ-SS9]